MASLSKTLTVTNLSSGGPDRVNISLTEVPAAAGTPGAAPTPGGMLTLNLNLSNTEAADYAINGTASLTLTSNPAQAPAPAPVAKQ